MDMNKTKKIDFGGKFDESTAREITAGVASAHGKRIVTRDGYPARIICWNAKGKRPIVALFDIGEIERVARYTKNGRHDERDNVRCNMDLIIIEEGGEA